jgi:hypothetical protein
MLVSNNPYGRAVDAAHPGRRWRLDSGLLGVVCVRVGNAAQAARIVRGPRSGGLIRLSAAAVVEADTDALPVGIDGEHVVLPSPVVCRSAPGALRVRVPRRRPHPSRVSGGAAGWPGVVRLALGLGQAKSPRRAEGVQLYAAGVSACWASTAIDHVGECVGDRVMGGVPKQGWWGAGR